MKFDNVLKLTILYQNAIIQGIIEGYFMYSLVFTEINRCIGEQMDGEVDGWMDGWMNE